MSARTLREVLASRPPHIESAGKLAREHSMETKSVTRILRELGYTLSDQDGGWNYSVTQDTKSVDPYDCYIVGISPGFCAHLQSKLVDFPDYENYTVAQATKTMAYMMAYLSSQGALPIRSQITRQGFKPLDSKD